MTDITLFAFHLHDGVTIDTGDRKGDASGPASEPADGGSTGSSRWAVLLLAVAVGVAVAAALKFLGEDVPAELDAVDDLGGE